ncbi:MAG: GTP pyrophosphokinase [Oscillospiraceae bacterium]
MIYTEKTKLAMKVCFEAHKDQVDKSGVPYVFHPVHLAEQMTDENTTIVALLHDVVEDSPISFSQLEEFGFSNDIIIALKLLTHDESIPYLEYVKKIKSNRISCTVKLADLRHNSDSSRLDKIDEKTIQRLKKYEKAISILEGNE